MSISQSKLTNKEKTFWCKTPSLLIKTSGQSNFKQFNTYVFFIFFLAKPTRTYFNYFFYAMYWEGKAVSYLGSMRACSPGKNRKMMQFDAFPGMGLTQEKKNWKNILG